MNDTNKEVTQEIGIVEQALSKEAKDIVVAMSETIQSTSAAYMKANEQVLAMYVILDNQSKDFFKRNHIEIEKGWIKYFEPVLNQLFPKGAWSYSTLKRFRAVNNTPAKKAVYLGLTDSISEKSQKAAKVITEEKKFQSALTRLNNLLTENVGKFTVRINNGLLVLHTVTSAPEKSKQSAANNK